MKFRSTQKELLDNDNIPFEDIIVNMDELNVVNTRLGGHAITLNGIKFFQKQYPRNTHLSIAEIGCGGGDNLRAIKNFLDGQNVSYTLTGIDIKKECIDFAIQNAPTPVNWLCSDYRNVVWPENKPDIIFTSLFCHHFTDDELVAQLQWLRQNSRLGFFINDLHRHPLAYYSISIITRLFSRSYLVKNDAPLSVKRGFTAPEWQQLLKRAGITNYSLKWKWAFRHLICSINE